MENLPIEQLEDKISTKRVSESLRYLKAKQALFTRFESADDFAVYSDEHPNEKELKAIEHHFTQVRASIAVNLWRNGLFIGINALDSILFQIAKSRQCANLVRDFLEVINDFGLHKSGFVLYPLHSFGILGYGFFSFFTEGEALYLIKEAGVAITAQTNSKEKLMHFLKEACSALGGEHEVPEDLIEHYIRSRPLKWITHNPLLLVRIHAFSNSYYENQFLLLIKINMATSLIFMLSALGNHNDPDREWKLGSSSMVNNWQTLDIHHYMVFQVPGPSNEPYNIDCVPTGVSRTELVEASDLNVELDPREWEKKPEILGHIINSLRNIESGYLQYCIGKKNHSVKARVYKKLFSALAYFRGSFRANSRTEYSIINLAMAFEILLTDFYAIGAAKRIMKRVEISLNSQGNAKSYVTAVEGLLRSRGEVVHKGFFETTPDFILCRKAFVFSFLDIISRLSTLVEGTQQPIGDILGDRQEDTQDSEGS